MGTEVTDDLPPGFVLKSAPPVRRTAAEDRMSVAARLSPAEQAASDAFERSPGNLAELRAEIGRTTNPETRRLLQSELDRQSQASDDELPPGFEVRAPAPPPPAAPPVPAGGTNALIPAAPGENRAPTPRAPGGIRSTIVGAVETALEMAAQMTGGYFDAVRAGGRADQQGTAGAEFVRRGLQLNPITGPAIAALERAGGGQGQQMSPRGREMTEEVGGTMANLPPVLGVHGTLAGPVAGGNVGVAAGRAKEALGKVGDAAMEAATPRMSPSTLKRAGAAVDADIPVSPHQLSGNKFLRMLGETAENLPFAGGGALRQARREKFSSALAKIMDPETDATVLDDTTFGKLQDTAGENIGSISSRYDVPADDFGDINALARRDTPDVQGVVKTFADDLVQIAQDNGGVVPGDTLRKLRTEAQSRARSVRSSRPDLANALDDVVHRFDEALANNIGEADAPALLEARRRYAISKTLEPLLARYPNGDFPPSALKSVVTSTKEGKRRMARGEGGDLGEYARLGQELLKDTVSSGTTERSTVHTALGLGTGAGAAFTNPVVAGILYGGASLYNLLGPKLVKKLVETQRRRQATAEPKAPELALQEYVRRPEGETPAAGPLGDLTPDWETAPGAGGAAQAGIDPAGMVRAVDEGEPLPQGIPQQPGSQIPLAESRPLGDLTPDWETAPGAGGATRPGAEPGLVPALGEQPPGTGTRVDMRSRAGQRIPAVPGRPDLPDTMVAGPPAELGADAATGAAMQTPEAELARRQQGAQRADALAAQERAEPVPVGEATEIRPEVVEPAPTVAAEQMHPEVAKIAEQVTKAREKRKQAETAAGELRRAAAATTDAELAAALRKRADAIAKEEKLPVGEVKEGQPEIKTSVPKKIPTGKATEVFNAPDQEPKQGSVQQERVQGNEGGQAAEAGAGDRVQRPAEGAGKAAGEESLSIDLPSIDEGFMDAQQRAQEAKAPPPSPRGRRQTRAALERGMADGTLDKDGAALALWALDRNPNLARGLRTEVTAGTEKSAKGSYNSAERIVKLFKGNTNPQTAVHEILHHSERMMPPEVQQGIRRAWERALKAEMEGASPEKRAAFEALQRAAGGDAEALATVKQAFKDGTLVKDHYQLTNPTEFWAVNGARILHERFTGRGSWRAEAIRWLRDMVEHVKASVGVRSDSAILKALEEVLDPSRNKGTDRSPGMIKSKKE